MQPTALTDDLVALAVAGREPERQVVLHALLPQVRFMISARLNPNSAQFHLAEDLVQEVMASLNAGLGTLKYQSIAGLKSFASSIASRAVAHAILQRGQFRPVADRSLDSTINSADLSAAAPLWSLLSASGASPPSAIDHANHIQQVLAELHKLKPEHREVITLAFFDQLNTHDIAGHLGISRPAASMLLIRAVNTLRRNLTGSSRILKSIETSSSARNTTTPDESKR